MRAQHDTGHTHTVAMLQRGAHLLAAHGASQALPFTALLLPLLNRAALATSRGRLLLDALHSVARLHDLALVQEAKPMAAWNTLVWNAAAFSTLLLNSALPRAPLVLALRLRALLFHPPPPVTVHYYTCDYCGSHVDHPWSHVAHSWPSLLIRSQWALVLLLTMIPKLEGSYLPDGATIVQPTIHASITVALEPDLHVPSSLPLHRWTVLSPSGLVRVTRPSSAAPEGANDRVRVVREAMADTTPSLTDLLMVLDTLEWPTRPGSALNPHVSEHCPHVVLPLSVAFLARWTTCHLQRWRMLVGGRLPLRMPPPPSAQWAPTVTFLVQRCLQDPSIAHLVQVHPEPLVILTIVSALQPLLQMLPGPMSTLAMMHHVLLWHTAVVHTLPSQDCFQRQDPSLFLCLCICPASVSLPSTSTTALEGVCPALRPRGPGVCEVHQSLTPPMRGTPWAPKALFGLGRQAQSPKPSGDAELLIKTPVVQFRVGHTCLVVFTPLRRW